MFDAKTKAVTKFTGSLVLCTCSSRKNVTFCVGCDSEESDVVGFNLIDGIYVCVERAASMKKRRNTYVDFGQSCGLTEDLRACDCRIKLPHMGGQ